MPEATLAVSLRRLQAKNTDAELPPVVLTLQHGPCTERTRTIEDFRGGAASLDGTVLSIKCELARNAGRRGYQKKEVFLAVKEASASGHRTLGMAKLNAADPRHVGDSTEPKRVSTSLVLGGKAQWAVDVTLPAWPPRLLRSPELEGLPETRWGVPIYSSVSGTLAICCCCGGSPDPPTAANR